MKAKLLILSAFVALTCISCGKTEFQNGKGAESSVDKEVSESANIPKNIDEVNTVDEEATKKGNIPAYEIHAKKTDKDGKIKEYTEVKNCFDDILSSDQLMDTEYEYKYNSDGLILEEIQKTQLDGYLNESLNTHKYDEYGEIVSLTSNLGEDMGTESRYVNEYDDKGRIIRAEYFLKYYGDIYGELQNEEQDIGFTDYKYDENGNVIETITDSPVLGKRKTVIEYDSRGNRISELETVIKDGEEKRGLDIYTTYNSRDLPEKQEWFRNDELVWRYEYEYTFYDEQGE